MPVTCIRKGVTTVTEMNTEEMTKRFHELFPAVITVDDLMRQAVNMYDEIERLRWELELAIKWRDNYKLAWERATGKVDG